jgi:hypothetical protein
MRILKIESLEPVSKSWIDRDVIMLHACFQILKDCVEKEQVDTHCNYESHKEFVDEIRFLYNWWIERSKKGLEEDKEDDLMLMRLIKIRGFLWT